MASKAVDDRKDIMSARAIVFLGGRPSYGGFLEGEDGKTFFPRTDKAREELQWGFNQS